MKFVIQILTNIFLYICCLKTQDEANKVKIKHKILVGKSERKTPHGIPTRRRWNNIKMYLIEIGCGLGFNCQWRYFADNVMNIWIT